MIFRPAPTPYPYVQIGEDQEIEQGAECFEGSEFFLTIRVFCDTPGFPEAKRIAAAIKAQLHEAELSLNENRLLVLMFESALSRREPDGLASSVVMVFRALTEPADIASEGSP